MLIKVKIEFNFEAFTKQVFCVNYIYKIKWKIVNWIKLNKNNKMKTQ